ncbi:MAG: N-acetylmuramoyl-L-alanine amidase, partial [Muribaculaceae bacterium]|nr:N-acetylmuramoyl-L-alanine amidase [Muribaculaceae bacterium]
YVGGLDSAGHAADTRTDAQKAALTALLKALRDMYPHASIRSHRDFAAKDCPCFNATAEYADL